MHKYMRAIGFSRLRKRDLDRLLFEIRRNPDHHQTALDSEGNEFVELRRELAPGMGLAMRGTYNDDGHFEMDYYFPYSCGREISTKVPAEVIRESARECYLGLCDDLRLGIDLIFYIQDMLTILESEQRNKKIVDFGGTTLGALSTEGKILMPVFTTAKQVENVQRFSEKHMELLSAAKEGDHEAYEELAMDDMDTYAMISDRIEREDLYSIITSYFMPSGIESDKYAVMGKILDCRTEVNRHSAETLFVMKIECNELIFDVCINSMDLFGMPEVGRRFKGKVWMQGSVHPISRNRGLI
ncbi:MAG: DUF3881 family protein [Lachnospiraceae bacterium]|nr:DUF3881 family protein [Lachnospiraceae bacterium]